MVAFLMSTGSPILENAATLEPAQEPAEREPCLNGILTTPFPRKARRAVPKDLAGAWVMMAPAGRRDSEFLQAMEIKREDGSSSMLGCHYYQDLERWIGIVRGRLFNVDGRTYVVHRITGSSVGCGGVARLTLTKEGLVVSPFPSLLELAVESGLPFSKDSPPSTFSLSPETLLAVLRHAPEPPEIYRTTYVRADPDDLRGVPCVDKLTRVGGFIATTPP